MARSILLVSVLATLALTGCVAKVGGRPVAGATLSEAPRSSAEVLGDLTTIEPCSLTDPEVFSQFGTAEFGAPESLDYCSISVKPDAATEVIVMVGQLGRLSDSPELQGQQLEEVNEDLYTVQPSNDPAFCSEALVFAEDDLTLEVSSSSFSGTSTVTCEMVAAGMDRVIEVVEDEAVAHRDPTPESLISLDPCELVTDETVTALPGFAAAARVDNPGGHQCYWETSPGEDRLSIRVMFGAGPAPTVYGGAGANSNPIAGRPSVTNLFPEAGSAAFCSVETGHIAFNDVADKPGMVEVASVFARVPAGQVQAGCQAAVAVATALWPRLPAS